VRSQETEFLEACKAGDESRVRAMLAQAPSLTTLRADTGETPLMAALYRGHEAIVDALVEARTPLDVFAGAALGRVDVVEAELVKDSKALDNRAYDGWTPLHLAAFFGRIDAARILLDAGASVHAVSRNSLTNTPLHAATAGKHSDVALLLLARGAKADVPDAGGYTPLQIAAQNQLRTVVDSIAAQSPRTSIIDPRD
jgi:uncharacterized protein